MLGAILKAIKEVFFSILGVVGVVSTGAGAAKQFGFLPNVPIHSWVLWLAAIVALFISAVRLQIQLDEARETSGISAPDMTLLELVQQIVGSDDLTSAKGAPEKTAQALLAIKEAAIQWRLTAWGRKNVIVSNLDLYPREVIGQDHWEQGYIDYLSFLKDAKCPTVTSGRDTYADLHFNRRQATGIWPKQRRKRFSLRSPIKFH